MATEDEVTPVNELAWALAEFGPHNKRIKAYGTYESYYHGNQPLAFATAKYRTQFWRLFKGYCDNMCMSVVDVQAERLEVIGFTSSGAEPTTVTYDDSGKELAEGAEPPTQPNPVDPLGPDVPAKTVTITLVNDDYADQAWTEWEEESMPLVADQVHSDVFLYGDAFVIADENGVWRQEPSEMAVRYSKEQPGVIDAAAKFWKEPNGYARLNVYTPAGLVKYRSKQELQKGKKLDEIDFAQIDQGTLPQGIPVVHFANKTYGRYGLSELEAVIPLQDALNKAETDLLISMEYQAFRQRWITGVDVELDESSGLPKAFVGQHGAGHFLAFADPETKVGEFSGAELKPYIDVIENLRAQIARVSGIPPHYFFVGSSGATVSGETLKVSESRFTRKGERQQRTIGKGWENVMDLVLEISSETVEGSTYDEGLDLNTIWEESKPRSESEDMDVLIKKGTIGVPNSQLQKESGYDPDEIAQFAIEYAQNVKAGLQAGPKQQPVDGGPTVPKGAGESPNSPKSNVSAESAVKPATE